MGNRDILEAERRQFTRNSVLQNPTIVEINRLKWEEVTKSHPTTTNNDFDTWAETVWSQWVRFNVETMEINRPRPNAATSTPLVRQATSTEGTRQRTRSISPGLKRKSVDNSNSQLSLPPLKYRAVETEEQTLIDTLVEHMRHGLVRPQVALDRIHRFMNEEHGQKENPDGGMHKPISFLL